MRAVFVVCAALLAVACSAPAAPGPTQAPAAASKPTQAPAAVVKPENVVPGALATAPTVTGPTAAEVKAAIDGYYEKAKASGETKIVIYGGIGDDWNEVLSTFSKTFAGISVERVNLRGPEMIQRLQAESAAGKQVANLVTHGQTTMSTVDKAGVLSEWAEGPPTGKQIPLAPLTEGKTRWSHSNSLFSGIVNTQLVPPDKIPTTRQQMLDPFFKGKGKLLFEDPRGGGPGLDVGTINFVQLGQPWLDGVKAQEATFVRDRDAAPAQIARGEYALFYPMTLNSEYFEMQKLAPVKIMILTDGGTSLQESTIGIVKGAPGQEAGKLFISWLLSDEGQRVNVEKRQTWPALPGLPGPPGLPSIEEVKPSKRTPDQIARNNEFIEIFDKAWFQ